MVSQRYRSKNSVNTTLTEIEKGISEAKNTGPGISDNSIRESAYGDDSVSSRALAPSSVTDKALANGAVGTDNIGIVNEINSDSSLSINAPDEVLINGGAVGFISEIIRYAGATLPTGWLSTDGSAVSRTTYANLFAVVGTGFGTGDGSTTFNLPNITGTPGWIIKAF